MDMVRCGRRFRAGADAEHFSVWLEAPQVVENRLKTTFVAEISGAEVAKKSNLFRLLSALVHIGFFSSGATLSDCEERRDDAIWKSGSRVRQIPLVLVCCLVKEITKEQG
jgi:hypothetical protein